MLKLHVVRFPLKCSLPSLRRAGEGPAFTFAPTLASSELDGMICREGLGDGGPAYKSSLVQVVCLVIYQHFSLLGWILSQVSLLYGTQGLAGRMMRYRVGFSVSLYVALSILVMNFSSRGK